MIAINSESAGSPSRALGYQFTPLPVALLEDRRLGHLIDRDLVVAAEMLAIGRWAGRDDSCWTTKAVLARRLAISERTVQASWSRLRARGWLADRATGPVDPEDSRNRTGRRFWFGWVAGPGLARDGGEKGFAPRGEKEPAPNARRESNLEDTTDGVVPTGPRATGTESDPPPASDDRPEAPGVSHVLEEVEAASWPGPLAALMLDRAIEEPLRRKLRQAIPGWLASHPVERVASAIRALLATGQRRRIRNPIGYLIGTLRNLEAEGDQPTELAPPPPPTRAPDADRTAERLSELRREQALAAERERRWRALPEAEREAIEARVDAECPRPAGVPTRFWLLTRYAACLEWLEAWRRPEAEGATVKRLAVGAETAPGALRA